MNQILVIGYGNPLRGDDGVGWRVAEAAAAVLPDPPVTVLTVQLLTLHAGRPSPNASSSATARRMDCVPAIGSCLVLIRCRRFNHRLHRFHRLKRYDPQIGQIGQITRKEISCF